MRRFIPPSEYFNVVHLTLSRDRLLRDKNEMRPIFGRRERGLVAACFFGIAVVRRFVWLSARL